MSNKDLSKNQKQVSIVVNVPCVKPYERIVTSRPVTFTCQQCDQTVTQERMPGPISSYCSNRCRLDAAAARKRISRATTGKNKGKRGRPKKNWRCIIRRWHWGKIPCNAPNATQLTSRRMDVEKANRIIFVLIADGSSSMMSNLVGGIAMRWGVNVYWCMLMAWDFGGLNGSKVYIIQR